MGAQPDPRRDFARSSPAASGKGLRVLIAEDSEIVLELACMMAKRLGIAAEGAADGFQAIQMVEAAEAEGDPYALVLMDFMMPVIDGVEATRRLRHAGFSAEELPVIALTAVIEPREIRRFTEAGGQGYLAKPLNLEKLGVVLEAWLPHRAPNPVKAQPRHSASLRSRYVERKQATFERIDQAVERRSVNETELLEIRDLLHKLAGTAGMFGDEALSDAAADCEQALIETGPAGALAVLDRYWARLGSA